MLDLRGSTSCGVLSGNLGSHLLTLVTNTEQRHLLARKLFNSRNRGCYFRFNVGENLMVKDWLNESDEALYHSLYGHNRVQNIPNLKDRGNVLIALDEYKEMS